MEPGVKRTPLVRRTPLRARSDRRRRVKARGCSNSWCRRVARVDEFCLPCAIQRADTIFRKLVRERDGRCIVAPWFPEIDCFGRLECSHLLGRGRHGIRWDLDNAVASCVHHHAYTTGHPLIWRAAIAAVGIDLGELNRRALANRRPYIPDVIADLTRKAAA